MSQTRTAAPLSVTIIPVILAISLTSAAHAAGPGTITYQGTVALPDGSAPPDGNYSMRFTLFDHPTTGTQQWQETYTNSVAVSSGAFGVQLGSVTSLPVGLFRDEPLLWLQIEADLDSDGFDADEIFAPRVAFAATPYAFHADTATNVTDLPANAMVEGENISLLSNDAGYLIDDTSVPKSHLTTSGTLGFDWSDSEVADDITVSRAVDADTVDGYHATDLFRRHGGSYVVAQTTSNSVTNGSNLVAAYAEASALTPDGQALGSTNRAVVLVPPGRYDLSTSSLTLDTNFVDLVGLSTARDDQYIFGIGVSDGVTTGVLCQMAGNVRIENLLVECTRSSGGVLVGAGDPAAYFPVDATTGDTILRNCEFRADGANAWSMRIRIGYAGTYERCKGGALAFGAHYGAASGTFIDCTGGFLAFGSYYGTASGTFTRCTGGDRSFASDRGMASGTFTDCIAGEWSFGGWYGTAGGEFTNCTGGEYAFGGYEGTASGTFNNCVATTASFGGSGGTATGTFVSCTGGDRAFGGYEGTTNGTFTNCTGGDYAFGGRGTAEGEFTNCTGGDYAFGGSDAPIDGIAYGTFINCTGGDFAFGGNGGATMGTFSNCRGGNWAFGGEGGSARGTFERCSGGEISFGGGTGGSANGARFLHCVGGAAAFTETGTPTPVHLFCTQSVSQYSGND